MLFNYYDEDNGECQTMDFDEHRCKGCEEYYQCFYNLQSRMDFLNQVPCPDMAECDDLDSDLPW